MKILANLILVFVATIFSLQSQALIVNGLITLDTVLDGSQQVDPVATTAFGNARVQFDVGQDFLDFRFNTFGISLEEVTFAGGPLAFGALGPVHLHAGLPGENGAIVFPVGDRSLYQRTSDGFQFQSLGNPIPDGLVELLRAGEVYVNVHTLSNPGGAIRGQLPVAPVPEPSTFALLGLAGLGLMIRRRKAA